MGKEVSNGKNERLKRESLKAKGEVRMKRILLSILVIGVLLLGACGAPTTAPPAEAPPAPPPAEEPAPAPAAFSVSNLTVQPAEVEPKEAVSITVSVTNTGGAEGSYTVVLKINDLKEVERSITIAVGSSEIVTFSVTREEPGSYNIAVDSLGASFTVVAPPRKPEIKGVTTYYEAGYFYIVGEVLNTTNSNINFVKVVATFYDEAGTVIGTGFTYTELDIIPPNDAVPFKISSYPDKIQPASYKLSSDYNTTSEEPFAGLSIKSHSATISMGYYEIVGEVENTSTMPAEFVKIVATYYNYNGHVIGTAFTYTEIDVVEAGGTSPFKLSSYPRKISPASYKLQVEGSEH